MLTASMNLISQKPINNNNIGILNHTHSFTSQNPAQQPRNKGNLDNFLTKEE
jgi:hypothetical protein